MLFILKQILRRHPFPGQMRLFHYLYKKGYLKSDKIKIAAPLTGNFAIYVNPNNLIDANIVYTGDYEPTIKAIFKSFVKSGDTVLDIGANIGFHTLYFSELVGKDGLVVAFEPIPSNYSALKNNVELNAYSNILPMQYALGAKNEWLDIHVDARESNPGAFNLFASGEKNLKIECKTGDNAVAELKLSRINFMKIDVEGYEQFVIEGLAETIAKYKPKIVFEYDENYQLRAGNRPHDIFTYLQKIGYSFYQIETNGLVEFTFDTNIKSAYILALPSLIKND